MNEQDLDRIRELADPAFAMVDHRRQGSGATTLEQLIAGFADAKEFMPDVRWERRMIAASGEVAASIASFEGHLRDEGGAVAFAYGSVSVVRDGLLVRTETFDADDEEAILARYEELRAEADAVRLAPGVDPGHPSVELMRRHTAAFAARDWDAYRALYAPDYEAVDHRQLGWVDFDAGAIVETTISAIELYPDMRETIEILAVAEGIDAQVNVFRGHTTAGGGESVITIGVVSVHADGRIVRDEFFDCDRTTRPSWSGSGS